MSYQALARKWRPKNFAEVVGQDHIVAALANGLDAERMHHAFLFAGTRGVGKTTLARILAKALNCEKGVSSKPCGECTACRGIDQGNFVDLIEVDAASRTKVDDTRELLDNVQYTPTQGRYKIYLIDEVHMLSTHSFNALLKTLEEPPPHVKFLLATTDPQKLPTTILSRCIQFNLKAMESDTLCAQLEKIISEEKIKFDKGAVAILTRAANGSVRDALSLLDQGIAFGNGEVREEKIRAMLGMIEDQFIIRLLGEIFAGDAKAAMKNIDEMAVRAADFSIALDELLTILHSIALYQVAPDAVDARDVEVAKVAELTNSETVQLVYQIALIAKRDLTLAPDPRSGFEMAVVRMIAFQPAAAKTPAPQTKHAAPTQSPPTDPQPEAIKIKLNELSNDKWAECLAHLNLQGITRQMMLHTALQSVQDKILHIVVDRSQEHLLDKDRIEKITTQFNNYFAQDIKLNIIFDDLSNTAASKNNGASNDRAEKKNETAAQVNEKARVQQDEDARAKFKQDPNVKELEAAFNKEFQIENTES